MNSQTMKLSHLNKNLLCMEYLCFTKLTYSHMLKKLVIVDQNVSYGLFLVTQKLTWFLLLVQCTFPAIIPNFQIVMILI